MNCTSRALAFLFAFVIGTTSLLAQQPGPPASRPDRMARTGPLPGIPGARRPVQPMAPAWLPLNPRHQQYVDQVLKYWEFKCSQMKRYRCSFKRFEYDPAFGPANTYKTYSEGVIKYSAPDKGLFRVDKTLQYQAPREQGGKPQYAESKAQGEYWVCDGHWVYQFDHRREKLVQTELPPEMRGKAIGKGPLPFLFNAKAEDIKRRFWVRIVTPPDAKGEYWLEAVPRTQEDFANFKMIHVIIDEADYLPKVMIVFDRNYVAGKRHALTSFYFNDREVNFSILASQLNLFHREFYEPAVPKGWTKEVQKWAQAPPSPAGTAGQQAAARR